MNENQPKMTVNMASKKLYDDIITMVNTSPLPAANVYYVIHAIDAELHRSFEQIVANDEKEIAEAATEDSQDESNEEVQA